MGKGDGESDPESRDWEHRDRPHAEKTRVLNDLDFWGQTARINADDMLKALLRSFRFAGDAQRRNEQMIMIDTRTFGILVAMAAMWVEDDG